MEWQYIIPPLVGAVIGLVTNKIAIWMLFHPQKKWRFLGLPLPFTPGVIPRDREILIGQLSEIIEEKLLSGEEIIEIFQSSGFREGIVDAIDETVDEKLSLPLIPENLLYNIKLLLSNKVLAFLETFLEKHGASLGQKMEIREKIQNKMLEFSLEELEALVWKVSGTHLRMITWLGGLLGFLLGFLHLGINFFMK